MVIDRFHLPVLKQTYVLLGKVVVYLPKILHGTSSSWEFYSSKQDGLTLRIILLL